MEMEEVKKEQSLLESQLASLKQLIDNLILEVEAQKNKVICVLGILASVSLLLCWIDHISTLQVASLHKDHSQAESELNLARMKMKECDSQITGILKEQEKLKRKITDTNLEKKRMENDVIFWFNSSYSCSADCILKAHVFLFFGH